MKMYLTRSRNTFSHFFSLRRHLYSFEASLYRKKYPNYGSMTSNPSSSMRALMYVVLHYRVGEKNGFFRHERDLRTARLNSCSQRFS